MADTNVSAMIHWYLHTLVSTLVSVLPVNVIILLRYLHATQKSDPYPRVLNKGSSTLMIMTGNYSSAIEKTFTFISPI